MKQTSRVNGLQNKIYELHHSIKAHLAFLQKTLDIKPKSNCPIIDLTDWQLQINSAEYTFKNLETQCKGFRKEFETIFHKAKEEELSIVHLENFINIIKKFEHP